ncbi:hypothetical protein [Streptomyces sp. NPDC058985]|uniref:hypothetical protein n=1 Tax=Streptomyces sp. NPDC058985 TaxID=3346684 RepID=UPI00367ED44A
MTSDQGTVYACWTVAASAGAGGASLMLAGHPIAGVLLLWLIPSLLLVAHLARLAPARTGRNPR